MVYCRRCNNTHWVKAQPRGPLDRIALLVLHRPYLCTKCERIQLGSIFIDFRLFGRRKAKRKSGNGKAQPDVKCPGCGGSVHRCRRRGFERLFVFTKAYRCFKCDTRFWKFTPV